MKFADLPPALVHAVLSAEDKRFFQHAGFDPFRVLKAAYVDLREGRIAEGASTLTMQLAGIIWLDRSQRTWKRKAAEVLITLHLEQKLSKEQIFEYYANQIDLGMRGSFSIRGFGEAAQAYFGKDVRDLTVAEAAVLAGIIQRPSWTNPVTRPERARQRRNVVLAHDAGERLHHRRTVHRGAGQPADHRQRRGRVRRRALLRRPGQQPASGRISRITIFNAAPTASTPLSTWTCSGMPPRPCASA